MILQEKANLGDLEIKAMRQYFWASLVLHLVCILLTVIEFPFLFNHDRVVPDQLPSVEFIDTKDLHKQNKAEDKPFVEEKKTILDSSPSSSQKLEEAVPDIKPAQKLEENRKEKTLTKILNDLSKKEKVQQKFDNILRNVEKKSPGKASKTSLSNIIDKYAGEETEKSGISSLTAPEEDMIRQQIYPNWFIPAGIKNAENIVVEIEVHLSETGEVLIARIVDEARCKAEQNVRVAAESAKRAVILSSPIKLPPKRAGDLRKFILRFNPRDILS